MPKIIAAIFIATLLLVISGCAANSRKMQADRALAERYRQESVNKTRDFLDMTVGTQTWSGSRAHVSGAASEFDTTSLVKLPIIGFIEPPSDNVKNFDGVWRKIHWKYYSYLADIEAVYGYESYVKEDSLRPLPLLGGMLKNKTIAFVTPSGYPLKNSQSAAVYGYQFYFEEDGHVAFEHKNKDPSKKSIVVAWPRYELDEINGEFCIEVDRQIRGSRECFRPYASSTGQAFIKQVRGLNDGLIYRVINILDGDRLTIGARTRDTIDESQVRYEREVARRYKQAIKDMQEEATRDFLCEERISLFPC